MRRESIDLERRRPGRLCLAAAVWSWATLLTAPHVLLGTDPAAAHLAEKPDGEVLFVRRIGPVLREKCLACHGPDEAKREGGLDLSTREGLLRGGDSSQPALVPQQPAESPLYLAVTRTHNEWSAMPPKEAERLTAEQVDWLREWIQSGAPWPDETRRQEIERTYADRWSAEDGVTVATSGGLSEEWTHRKYRPEGLWGYQPVRKPVLADVTQHPIDALLALHLPEGLPLAPTADRRTLIRRVTFDLTGLPPTPDEVVAFVRDEQPDELALAVVVDRLLASPHYGERMAQHWLDVVRYADSSGFANDFERGNAWRYRDYVVRAFNSDKPFDQFIREQIAGDEIDPADPEKLIATGFLRMGPWELTGMEVAKVARQRFLDDVTNSVGETFLAHSLQCARCHDHKFDPVPTRDYYGIQAVFATTQLCERPAAFLPTENTAGFEERRYLEARRETYTAMLERLDQKLLAAADQWFEEHQIDPTAWQEAVEQSRQQGGKRGGSIFAGARTVLTNRGVPEDKFPPKLYGFTPEDFGNERVARKGIERLQWELDRYQPYALAVYDGRTPDVKAVLSPVRMPTKGKLTGELEQTCILVGGDPFSPGQEVSPGILSVLQNVPHAPLPDEIAGRRRAFAEWVASPENPLTTRTIVNRVWLWHFNQPLAGNPNNFGSTGKRPTHPELLDWLAATLVEDGWSLKSLQRRMLLSEAYRRSSTHPEPARLSELDPTGASYAVFQPRRLTAEELRDAMLAASGELNPTLGGIPNRPEINPEAALQPRMVMGTFAAAWTPNPLPSQRHRRSLYALKLRGLVDPLLEVFNAPGPDFSCERRDASTVTPQVFSLFNSQASQSRSLALARRALQETSTEEQALVRCFELTLARQPTPEELQACREHWRAMLRLVEMPPPAVRPPLEVRREAVEENTGEKFAFQEPLYSNRDFVPDLQPADVDARTRALADVCLVLFNTNEFAYLH